MIAASQVAIMVQVKPKMDANRNERYNGESLIMHCPVSSVERVYHQNWPLA